MGTYHHEEDQDGAGHDEGHGAQGICCGLAALHVGDHVEGIIVRDVVVVDSVAHGDEELSVVVVVVQGEAEVGKSNRSFAWLPE